MSRQYAPEQVCGEVNSMYGYVCGRDPDHIGSHIQFGTNATVAWGDAHKYAAPVPVAAPDEEGARR